jgi:hypothetical protein
MTTTPGRARRRPGHDVHRRLRHPAGGAGLVSTLEEWRQRASGAAPVDYGFHMAITHADEGTIDDMAQMVEQGVSTFKVFLAYRGELMGVSHCKEEDTPEPDRGSRSRCMDSSFVTR